MFVTLSLIAGSSRVNQGASLCMQNQVHGLVAKKEQSIPKWSEVLSQKDGL
jgi:hypothetical protein